MEAPPKKAPKDAPLPPKVGAGAAYVSQAYGGWQEACLRILQKHYDGAANAFPPEAAIMEAIRSSPLGKQADFKDLIKAAMPFVKFRMEAAVGGAGSAALQLTLPFDEAALLRDNADYIMRALGLRAPVEIRRQADGAASPFAARIAAAHPGAPAVVWDVEKAPAPPQAPATAGGGSAAPAAKGGPAPAQNGDSSRPTGGGTASAGPQFFFPWWDERSVRT